jgi:two-component system sensor histidine kinase AtoS
MDTPALELKNIHFSIGNYQILQNVSLTLNSGEIHAVVGEHNAGKTSLVRVMGGEVPPDRGQILIRGVPHNRLSIQGALKERVGIVHQDPQVIPNLSALENIVSGTIPPGVLRHKYILNNIARCRSIFEEYLGSCPDLGIPLSHLSPKEQQMVELARVIYRDSSLIIVDDVGRRFNPQEMSVILQFLKEARERGKAVLFVDTDIDNVLAVADRVTTLHNGFVGETEETRHLDRVKLLKLTYNFALNIEPDRDPRSPLVVSKHYNEQVIANLPSGVIILDGENRVSLANRAAEQILDRTAASLGNLALEDLFSPLSDEVRSELVEAVSLRQGRSWDVLVLASDLTVRIRTMPYVDDGGDFKGTIILIENNTMDSSVKDYLARAEKISTIAELAAGVSHEINNPLAIINNYLQILKMKTLDDDTADKLARIEGQLKRITDITGSLLSFSRFKEAPLSPIDLVPLLNEVTVLLSYKTSRKELRLNMKNIKGECWVRGDESRLRQVFVNLLNNSIEAVPVRGRIDMMIEKEEGSGDLSYMVVSLRDNGCGIPHEIQAKIFDPFFSTKITRENAGLGLSICQHIIESHKGLLTFDSRPGESTVFRVYLPVA